MSFIIGIGHRSRHGKDTVANFMVEELKIVRPDLKIIKYNWASKLKNICHQLYGWAGLREEDFYDRKENEHLRNVVLPAIGKTPVEIWIDMGTPAVRERVYEKTWVDYIKYAVDSDIVICAGTRFPNEIEASDYTIKVENPRIPNREGKSVDDVLADFRNWNHVILNNGSLDFLKYCAKDAVRRVLIEFDNAAKKVLSEC